MLFIEDFDGYSEKESVRKILDKNGCIFILKSTDICLHFFLDNGLFKSNPNTIFFYTIIVRHSDSFGDSAKISRCRKTTVQDFEQIFSEEKYKNIADILVYHMDLFS